MLHEFLRKCRIAVFLLVALAGGVVGASAQDAADTQPQYRIGVGDVLQLSVWQQPDLDRQLRVRDDGTIVVPLVGAITAENATLTDLEALLTRRLRAFNRDITEVSLTIAAYNSFEVYVMGSVSDPGAFTFDQLPTVWDAVRAAGGPLTTANLRRVRVMRQDGSSTHTIVVDIGGAVSGRTPLNELPALQPGDTVVVPDLATMTAGDRENGIHVMGRVNEPRFYPLDEPSPLMTVILRAGGFAEGADLGAVRWVHPTDGGPLEARKVDVRLFLEDGQEGSNPLVHPGDTVYVEGTRSTFSLLGLFTASTGLLAVLINVLRN